MRNKTKKQTKETGKEESLEKVDESKDPLRVVKWYAENLNNQNKRTIIIFA